MKTQAALQQALQYRLDTIRIRNPGYSLRAFAKKAGVSPATLSLILQGKRSVSRKMVQLLCEKLGFDPQERAEALRRFQPTLKGEGSDAGTGNSGGYLLLTVDQYQVVSDWRAFAILNLIAVVDFRNDTKWIAGRLGLTETEVEETISRLKRLEMLTEKDGVLSRTTSQYKTTDDVMNLSLRKSHAQTLDLAQAALENEPVERRDFTWVTFPMDPSKMSETKTLIRKFQDELLELNEEQAHLKEVYRLAVQLFPLTKNQNGGSLS